MNWTVFEGHMPVSGKAGRVELPSSFYVVYYRVLRSRRNWIKDERTEKPTSVSEFTIHACT